MRILNILLYTSLVIACVSGNSNKLKHFRNLTSDTLLYKYLSSKAAKLNLARINLGVDSFEFRVWHGSVLLTPKQLVILKYNDSSWQLTETDYWLHYQNNYPKRDIIVLDSCFTKQLMVQMPLSQIIDSIEYFRLDTFPSQDEIPGFKNNVADGMSFTIELATSKYYKAISYNNPKFYTDPYNKKITNFLLFLKNIGVNSIY
jgi:hypothetical protein